MKRNYHNEMENKVELIISLIVLVAIVSSLYLKGKYINLATEWGTLILISVITTGFCQMIIQRISGNLLEKIPLTVTIAGKKFSFSLFFVITILLKLIIF